MNKGTIIIVIIIYLYDIIAVLDLQYGQYFRCP